MIGLRAVLVADESVGAGDDAGPDPYGLLLTVLGACKVMTVQMYAGRTKWPLDGAKARLTVHKIHAHNGEDCESDPNTRVDIIEVELTLLGDLTAEQVSRLAQIALCTMCAIAEADGYFVPFKPRCSCQSWLGMLPFVNRLHVQRDARHSPAHLPHAPHRLQ